MPEPKTRSTASKLPAPPIDETKNVLYTLSGNSHEEVVRVLKTVMAFYNVGNVELTGVE